MEMFTKVQHHKKWEICLTFSTQRHKKRLLFVHLWHFHKITTNALAKTRDIMRIYVIYGSANFLITARVILYPLGIRCVKVCLSNLLRPFYLSTFHLYLLALFTDLRTDDAQCHARNQVLKFRGEKYIFRGPRFCFHSMFSKKYPGHSTIWGSTKIFVGSPPLNALPPWLRTCVLLREMDFILKICDRFLGCLTCGVYLLFRPCNEGESKHAG